MGRLRIFAGIASLCLASSAFADSYDFRIAQLGNPQPGGTGYTPEANNNFRIFARQLGAAITSVNLSPPETLGHSGFAFAFETSLVNFGNTTVPLPTEKAFTGPLVIPSLHVRKGLPFSFEIGARAAWLGESRMGAGTLELKWAVNEGFTYLPDIAIRGNITKLLNSRDFDLTCGGLDLGIGKQFALGGMVTVTPYAGWNLLFVGASTGNVDFNPNRTLAQSDKPTEQFRDVYVFESLLAIKNSHNRFYAGLRFIGGVLILGAEVSYSILGKFQDAATHTDREIPAVLTGNFTIGLDF